MEYIVTMRFQFPAWDEKRGINFRVEASSKSNAIKRARHLADVDGHISHAAGKGRITFKAEEQE